MFKAKGKIISFNGINTPSEVVVRASGELDDKTFTIVTTLHAYRHVIEDFRIGDEIEITFDLVRKK